MTTLATHSSHHRGPSVSTLQASEVSLHLSFPGSHLASFRTAVSPLAWWHWQIPSSPGGRLPCWPSRSAGSTPGAPLTARCGTRPGTHCKARSPSQGSRCKARPSPQSPWSLAQPDRLLEGHVFPKCPVTPGSALPCNADGPFHTTGLSQKPSVHFLICACHLDTCAADIGRGPNGLQSVIPRLWIARSSAIQLFTLPSVESCGCQHFV